MSERGGVRLIAGLAVALLVCGVVLVLRPVTFGWVASTAYPSDVALASEGWPPGAFLAPWITPLHAAGWLLATGGLVLLAGLIGYWLGRRRAG